MPTLVTNWSPGHCKVAGQGLGWPLSAPACGAVSPFLTLDCTPKRLLSAACMQGNSALQPKKGSQIV